jgi:putative chitinase
MAFYKLTPERAAHFFAQTAHETGEFKLFTENLNYSSDGLKKTFGKYFPGDLANSYSRNPEKIANRVYGSRMGNGDETSGDGFRFRGRGALQLTGKSNYEAFVKFLNLPDLIKTPDLVATTYAFESAIFFFDRNKLWSLCDTVTDASILAVTKRINGGTNGLDHRSALTKKYYGWLKA